MNNKNLLLGLTVLATPFVVENIVEENVASANQTSTTVATQKQTATTTKQVAKSSEYLLNKPAKAYVTAKDAAQRVNQKATYQAGEYYVYNQSQGMVNISKARGKVGSWINPVDNPNAKTTTVTKPTNQTTASTPVKGTNISLTPLKGGQYSLLKSTDAYINAIDASKKVNVKGTVSAGNYYIYREYKGMLNVSRAKGKVGSWINPTETLVADPNKIPATVTETKPTTPTTEISTSVNKPTQTVGNKTSGGMFEVTNPTEAYINAADATKKVNAKGKVSVGNYHIFREYKGMFNVSRVEGKAGSWINPGLAATTEVKPTTPETKTDGTTTKLQTVGTKTSAGLFALTSPTEAYVNSADATKRVNAKGMLTVGSYHIFREYKGMLNISKVKGKVGSWINPSGAVIKLPETKSSTKEVTGAGVKYYTQDNSTWANKRYGISNMKHAGCVPTSLAMVVSTLSGKNVSPLTIADYLYKNTNTFNKKYEGTTSDGIPPVLKKYGLNYKVLKSKTALQSELGKGNMVLSLVQGANFVTPGYTHAVVAKGLDLQGKTTVYNPLSKWGIKKFATDTLWKNQSTVSIDRTLGGTFISIFK